MIKEEEEVRLNINEEIEESVTKVKLGDNQTSSNFKLEDNVLPSTSKLPPPPPPPPPSSDFLKQSHQTLPNMNIRLFRGSNLSFEVSKIFDEIGNYVAGKDFSNDNKDSISQKILESDVARLLIQVSNKLTEKDVSVSDIKKNLDKRIKSKEEIIAHSVKAFNNPDLKFDPACLEKLGSVLDEMKNFIKSDTENDDVLLDTSKLRKVNSLPRKIKSENEEIIEKFMLKKDRNSNIELNKDEKHEEKLKKSQEKTAERKLIREQNEFMEECKRLINLDSTINGTFKYKEEIENILKSEIPIKEKRLKLSSIKELIVNTGFPKDHYFKSQLSVRRRDIKEDSDSDDNEIEIKDTEEKSIQTDKIIKSEIQTQTQPQSQTNQTQPQSQTNQTQSQSQTNQTQPRPIRVEIISNPGENISSSFNNFNYNNFNIFNNYNNERIISLQRENNEYVEIIQRLQLDINELRGELNILRNNNLSESRVLNGMPFNQDERRMFDLLENRVLHNKPKIKQEISFERNRLKEEILKEIKKLKNTNIKDRSISLPLSLSIPNIIIALNKHLTDNKDEFLECNKKLMNSLNYEINKIKSGNINKNLILSMKNLISYNNKFRSINQF